MVKSKELLGLTGYVHGGCSPLGMKKPFPTFADETAADFATIIFSAGKIGFQIEAPLAALEEIVGLKTARLTV
jgi:Cys-tRNA(Pro)/Cys-tRNA(Cys) deacylase